MTLLHNQFWHKEPDKQPDDINVKTCMHLVLIFIAFNTLRTRHNSNFPDDIFKCIFLNENVWISNMILLNFFPMGPIDKNTTLSPVRRQAIIWTNDGLGWWRIYASPGLNESKRQHITYIHCCSSCKHGAYHVYHSSRSGVGVTKAPFANFSVTGNYDLAKV